MNKTLGVITMSGDPITLGHLWMVEEALGLFSNVEILIGNNSNKKYLFDIDMRRRLAQSAVSEYFSDEKGRDVMWDEVNRITFADRVKVSVQKRNDYVALELEERYDEGYEQVCFVRGLRNGFDLAYEQGIHDVNRRVAPNLTTIYLFPPLQLQNVSSSTVKELFRLKSWPKVARQYVTPSVASALQIMADI